MRDNTQLMKVYLQNQNEINQFIQDILFEHDLTAISIGKKMDTFGEQSHEKLNLLITPLDKNHSGVMSIVINLGYRQYLNKTESSINKNFLTSSDDIDYENLTEICMKTMRFRTLMDDIANKTIDEIIRIDRQYRQKDDG